MIESGHYIDSPNIFVNNAMLSQLVGLVGGGCREARFQDRRQVNVSCLRNRTNSLTGC